MEHKYECFGGPTHPSPFKEVKEKYGYRYPPNYDTATIGLPRIEYSRVHLILCRACFDELCIHVQMVKKESINDWFFVWDCV